MGKLANRVIAVCESDFVQGDDKNVVFWPLETRGVYTSQVLRIIADEMDRRNALWISKMVDEVIASRKGFDL